MGRQQGVTCPSTSMLRYLTLRCDGGGAVARGRGRGGRGQGTAKRSEAQLEADFESLGGHFNVSTCREKTVYTATVLKKDVPKALDVLADIVQNSTYSAAAVDKERGVILKELAKSGGDVNQVWAPAWIRVGGSGVCSVGACVRVVWGAPCFGAEWVWVTGLRSLCCHRHRVCGTSCTRRPSRAAASLCPLWALRSR